MKSDWPSTKRTIPVVSVIVTFETSAPADSDQETGAYSM